MTHRYVEEFDEQEHCLACKREIDCDQAANCASRCYECFDKLSPREQERLHKQDRLLWFELRVMYPAGLYGCAVN